MAGEDVGEKADLEVNENLNSKGDKLANDALALLALAFESAAGESFADLNGTGEMQGR